MKVVFTIKDRITLANLLQEKTGDFLTIKSLRVFKEQLSVTDKEAKEIKMVMKGGSITWDSSKEKDITYSIPNTIVNLIKESLQNLDAKKQLNDNHVKLYEVFVVTENKKIKKKRK